MLEFQISAGAFQQALGRCATVLASSSTMPILGDVLIEAERTPEGGRVRFSAYDLEIGISSVHPAEVPFAGRASLPGKALQSIAKSGAGSVIHLRSLANFRARLACGNTTYELAGHDPDEFPAIPVPDDAEFRPVNQTMLLDLIEHTAFAASADETRLNLCGVCLEAEPQAGLRMIATDGHRLAMAEHSDPEWRGSMKVVIPSKAVAAIRHELLEDTATPPELAITPQSVVLRRSDVTLVARLIDAQFPDWREAVPEPLHKLEVSRLALLGAVERVTALAPKDLRTVRFTVNGHNIELRCESADFGWATETLLTEFRHEGPAVTFGLQARYLVDALKRLDGRVALEWIDPVSAFVVRSLETENTLNLVMPLLLDTPSQDGVKPSPAAAFVEKLNEMVAGGAVERVTVRVGSGPETVLTERAPRAGSGG